MPLSTCIPAPVVDILHGIRVVDPYRWLEDRTSPSTEQWIADQKRRHDAYFAQVPSIEAIRSRVRHYLNVDSIDQAAKVAGRFFYRRRREDQEQACICVKDAYDGPERVLVDPAGGGAFASVGIFRISDDGSLLAYELKEGGGDAKEIHVVDTASGITLADYVPTGYARGFAFAPDNSGFYYCQERPFADEHTIRFHSFGQISEDAVLLRKNRTINSRLILAADTVHIGSIWYYEAANGPRVDFWLAYHQDVPQWWPIFIGKAGVHVPLLHRGRIFLLSDEHARNRRLVELRDDGTELRLIVPESDAPIQGICVVGDMLLTSYFIQGKTTIHGWSADGADMGEVPLASNGTLQILPNFGAETDHLFYTSESFTEPITLNIYAPATRESSVWGRCTASIAYPLCKVKSVSFGSSDGTAIPMSLVMRQDLNERQVHPVILTSYGGFGTSMTPKFSFLVTIMLELGAIFALPNIRGGSEFGKAWHEAARGRNRQTAFDDFISAAEWLVDEGVTSPDQLAIFGGSNSGLLVGAAMTQRPNLFRAVLCIAPLLDMVRYEQFDTARKWKQEYGTTDDAEDFAALHAYSPYHRVQEDVNYPSILFVTGDRDDRCNPAHVRKTAARIQDRIAQKHPILVDHSRERGHSPVLPLSVRSEAMVRRIGFLCNELGIAVPNGVIQ